MRASSGPADPRRGRWSGRTSATTTGDLTCPLTSGGGTPARRGQHVGVEQVRQAVAGAIRARVAGPSGPDHAAGAVRLGRSPLVRSRPADLAGPRRRLDLRGRAASAAAPEPPPAGHGRRGRPLRLPRRPVGPAAADRALPRRHDLRHRGAGRPGLRDRASRAPAGPRHRPRRPPVRRQRSPPPDLGPHRGGRQLPGRLPALRRAAHGPGRAGRLHRRPGPRGRRPWACPTRPARWPGCGTASTPTDPS